MIRTLALAVLLVAPPSALAADAARLVVVGESPAEAQLEGVVAGGLNVDVAGQPRTVAWEDLVSWGAPVEPKRGPQWWLTDGGLMTGELVEADSAALTLQSEALGRVTLPLERLRGALFAPPSPGAARDALTSRVLGAGSGKDRIWLANGDELRGEVRSLGRNEIEFESDVGPLKVPRANVVALAFDRPGATPSTDRLHVGLRDGSRLSVSRVTLDAKNVQLQIDGGESWSAPREALVWIRGASPRVTYLSDLRPSGYRHVPFLEQKWDYQLDRNVTGGQLRVGGRLAAKGVGLHSTSLLSWNVPPGSARFAAEVGIDDSTGGPGSVVFRVFLDAREAAASGPVRGGEPPRELVVELGSAKTLSLVVDFADRGDVLDRADWLDARIER